MARMAGYPKCIEEVHALSALKRHSSTLNAGVLFGSIVAQPWLGPNCALLSKEEAIMGFGRTLL